MLYEVITGVAGVSVASGPGCGDDPGEGAGEGAVAALPERDGPVGGPGAVSGEPADPGASGERGVSAAEDGVAAPDRVRVRGDRNNFV